MQVFKHNPLVALDRLYLLIGRRCVEVPSIDVARQRPIVPIPV
jgi:hypothetical protein